jgi:hypothetical protein
MRIRALAGRLITHYNANRSSLTINYLEPDLHLHGLSAVVQQF